MTEQSSEIIALGHRLRALRERSRLSLRDVGATSGLSPSFIGALERGKTEIAITRLMRLAEVYGVTVADLLVDLKEAAGRLHVRLSDCQVATADDGRIEIFYAPAPIGFFQPFRLVLHPGARQDGFQHATPEIHQCLSGQALITLDAEPVTVAPGDTVFVPAGMVHGWSNDGSEPAVLLGTVALPDHVVRPSRVNGSSPTDPSQP